MKLIEKLRAEGTEKGDARAWVQWRIVGLSAALAIALAIWANMPVVS